MESELKRYRLNFDGSTIKVFEDNKGYCFPDYDALRTERDELVEALGFFLELYQTSAGDSQDGWVMAFDTADKLLTRIKEQANTTKGGET